LLKFIGISKKEIITGLNKRREQMPFIYLDINYEALELLEVYMNKYNDYVLFSFKYKNDIFTVTSLHTKESACKFYKKLIMLQE